METKCTLRRQVHLAILTFVFLSPFICMAFASTPLPSLKPGLWILSANLEVNGKTIAMPPAFALCSNSTTGDLVRKIFASRIHCSKFLLAGSHNVYTIDSTCYFPQTGETVSHTIVTYVGESAETLVIDIKSSTLSEHMEEHSQWRGDCPIGVAPGEVGVIVNGVFKKEGQIPGT